MTNLFLLIYAVLLYPIHVIETAIYFRYENSFWESVTLINEVIAEIWSRLVNGEDGK